MAGTIESVSGVSNFPYNTVETRPEVVGLRPVKSLNGSKGELQLAADSNMQVTNTRDGGKGVVALEAAEQQRPLLFSILSLDEYY